MMLRSSSTPLLSSLLPSVATAAFAESPNHHQPPSAAVDDHLSFPSPSPLPRLRVGFRRVQSEGNLDGLAAPPKRSAAVLEAIPLDAEEPGESDIDEEDGDTGLDERVAAMCGGFGGGEAPLFLARGLGIDGISGFSRLGDGDGGYGGGGGGGGYPTVTGYGGGQSDLEEFLKKMVEEHPSDALFLRNYAQFLHKEKKDIGKAEEYYSRAILASPGDGEILMEYAKLIWTHHSDRERAGQYFEQAVQASPHDCHVLAEYAHFLWADSEEEGDDPCNPYGGPAFPSRAVADATA